MNKPNYRITIRPDKEQRDPVRYCHEKWGIRFPDERLEIVLSPVACVGTLGYHPDSSKLKKV